MKLSELIRQDRFASAGHEAVLNVMVTHSWLNGVMAAAMAPFDITPAQYNVLRILRGSDSSKMTCSDVGSRLLDRTPDVTRLLNRLETAHFITRSRSRKDRRVVQVAISAAGRELLGRMEPVMHEVQEKVARHLSESELGDLSSLLERLRTDQVA